MFPFGWRKTYLHGTSLVYHFLMLILNIMEYAVKTAKKVHKIFPILF